MKYVILFVGTTLTLMSCVENNPSPSWIEVNEIVLETNPSSVYPTGELTENLSDAWIYVNDELMGVFELPVKIPVLTSGPANIKVYPAVLNNGISATKKIYPFVEFYEENVTLNENATVTLNPTTHYYSSVQFEIEDFEGAGNIIEDDPVSMTSFSAESNPAILESFNGNAYGHVTLTSTDSTWIAYTKDLEGDFNLPIAAEVYLEIDYHTTNSLVTGLIGVGPSGIEENPYIQLNPMDPSEVTWKKIYIDLREIVSNSPDADYFKVSFEAFLDPENTIGEINIDNIKLVHF